VEKIALFATDPADQLVLARLASKLGKQEFHDTISQPKLSLYELLRRFSSLRFDTPGQFLELAPRLSPRDYTVASSSRLCFVWGGMVVFVWLLTFVL
jgi:sulfite reductase alpha subunit-like flavoprotein